MEKTILVIDDEEDIREIVQASLEIIAKFDVILAATSQEGLEIAATRQPDAILLDVLMPQIDGLMVLQQLKSDPVTHHIPVIFLTARTQFVEQKKMMNLGAAGIITKPFRPVSLAQQIKEIMGWGN